MDKYTLIIDQGGHSSRAIAFNQQGVAVDCCSEVTPPPLESTEGFVEFSSTPLIQSSNSLLHEILQRLSHRFKATDKPPIDALGVIAQRSSLIACNKTTAQAITPMISWQDTRHADWLAQQSFDIEEWQQLTGLRLSAHAGASKIRWLLDHHPEVQRCAKKNNLMFIPWGAYLLHQLMNKTELVCDISLAARTGLSEYGVHAWSDKLLSLFDIPKTCLPPIVPSAYDYGNITVGGHVIPVKLLGGDQQFIPLAYGEAALADSAFLNIGSGAFIQARTVTAVQTDKTPKQANGLLTSQLMVSNNKTAIDIMEGTINGAATSLDWWQAQQQTPLTFTEVNHALTHTSTAPIFINTLTGTGSPYWIPAQTARFITMHDIKISTQEQKTVAILESILFSCKINFDLICEENTDIEKIIISGGLSASDPLCQKLADLTGVAILRYDDTEASARGAAFYLHSSDHYPVAQAPTRFTPKTTGNAVEVRFTRYREEMEKLSKKHNK
ncbi:MAG: glycerol kinase [Candidatus Endobugula sp.]|jgi:glycerol kinase